MSREIVVRPVTGFFKEGWSLQRFMTKANHLDGLRGDPHQVLSKIFKAPEFPPLPIRGGWGYSQRDAVIIDRNHPVAERPFNGVRIEYKFAQLRMWLELITVRPEGQRHSQCKYNMRKQELIHGKDGKVYDVLHCDITALPDADFEELKAEWEGPHGYSSPSFDQDVHMRKREALLVRYSTEYWFEISSFFGKQFEDEEQDCFDPSQINLQGNRWKKIRLPASDE